MVQRNRKTTAVYVWLVIMLLVQMIFLSGCLKTTKTDTTKDHDLVIGMTQDISGFYPWMTLRDTSTLTVNKNLFNSLVEMDPVTYRFVPALTEQWNNPDNVTWRFILRKNVTFHNGNRFTADDVKFTIEYMKEIPYFNEELASISKVNILDEYTVDIKTVQPYPMLLYKLGGLYILSQDYINSMNQSIETWPIGTGAYQLVEYIPGDHVTLSRFDDYWKGLPEVTKVSFQLLNTSADLKTVLMSGDIDLAPIQVEDVDDIQSTPGLAIESIQTPGVIYLSFDFRTNDSYRYPDGENPTADVRVRTAMYQAIDIDTILEKYVNGSATTATQFLTYHTFGYNPNISRLPYDVDRARDLMRKTGYDAGFSIEMDLPDVPKWVNISNEIARQLRAINITVQMNPQPWDVYYAKLYEKNTSLYITGITPYDAEGLLGLLLCTPAKNSSNGIWNYGNYSNPEVDRLCEVLTYTMDTKLRLAYIQEAFSIANADVAWVPLFSSIAFYGIRDDIEWKPRPSLFIWVEEISFTE